MHALMSLTNELEVNTKQKKVSVLVSLDIEKAFDTIWIKSLLFKMILLTFPRNMIKFLDSYLTNRKFRVNIGGVDSTLHDIAAGVPQGSILGPLLYIFGTHDIPQLPYTKIGMFADDTSITASSVYPTVAIARAQRHLDPSKTTFALFTRRNNIATDLSLTYNSEQIRQSDFVKLLGVTLDRRLTYTPHVKDVVQRSKSVVGMLDPLCRPSSGLNTTNKISLFKVFVRPVMTYGFPVWNVTSKSNIGRIQIEQNKYMRRALNLRPDPVTFRQVTNARLHEIASMETVSQYAKRLILNCYVRMRNHSNPLIQELAEVGSEAISGRNPFYVLRDYMEVVPHR